MLKTWASAKRSSLLIICIGPRVQGQARILVAEVLLNLKSNSPGVCWASSAPCASNGDDTIASVSKSLAHQALQRSANHFIQFAEQLNLIKEISIRTDGEWPNLIILLLTKVTQDFLVLEA